MPFTAAAAGTLVAFLVFVEAPVSGTSLNPARTLGPALVGGTLTNVWIYLLAPPLGALVAALVYRHRRSSVACGKLFHSDRVQCRFLDCQYTPPDRRVNASHTDSTRSVPRRPAAHFLCSH
jgi:aquaporin Z